MAAPHQSRFYGAGSSNPSGNGVPSPNPPIDPTLPMYTANNAFYRPYPPQMSNSPDGGVSSSEAGSLPNSPAVPFTHASSTHDAMDGLTGKRSGSQDHSGNVGPPDRKRARKDDDDDDIVSNEPSGQPDVKPKSTRGSRACTNCRRLKMKCVGAEQGPPCKRCQAGGHECIFEESNRGKRSSKKHEILHRSLKKMEHTLDTVLRSLSNPHLQSLASGMVSRSPSPGASPAGSSEVNDQASGGSRSLTRQTQNLTSHNSTLPAASSASPHVKDSNTPTVQQPPTSPKLHSLPDNALNPLGLLAEASLANRREKSGGKAPPGNAADAGPKVGVANETYFKPGPMTILPLRRLYIERQIQPEMLGFVSTEEVVELFKIFFDHLNLHAPVLQRDFHTPSLICSRSPFLLTTICAISAKFYSERTELYPRLNKIAKKLAFSVPEQGYKSVEIVQAYLLLSLWGCGPVERYEQDKTWLLLGLAIRVGTDLNLHRKSSSSLPLDAAPEEIASREAEIRNRERTWLFCFILDRSFSAQMGKPHSIKEDFIIRNAAQWWRQPGATQEDAGVAAYVEMQRILSRSLDFLYSGTSTASGLQTDCDYLLVIKTIETQLLAWMNEWEGHVKSRTPRNDPTSRGQVYRLLVAKFYYHYGMLVINSFGLQNALERSPVDMGHFFGRCHSSAVACATIVKDELGPLGHLRYSPDSHFVLISYAVLTLLKLIRPEFQAFLTSEQKTLSIVQEIADLLESIAANPMHTPALYSTFLRALITAKAESGSRATSPPASGAQSVDSNGAQRSNEMSSEPVNPQMFEFNSLRGIDYLSGEMGPVLDMSTFPPTMAPDHPMDDQLGASMSMDSILSTGFWDNVLIPGYSNTFEGLSGGFVYGAGGSGFITPRRGSPEPTILDASGSLRTDQLVAPKMEHSFAGSS